MRTVISPGPGARGSSTSASSSWSRPPGWRSSTAFIRPLLLLPRLLDEAVHGARASPFHGQRYPVGNRLAGDAAVRVVDMHDVVPIPPVGDVLAPDLHLIVLEVVLSTGRPRLRTQLGKSLAAPGSIRPNEGAQVVGKGKAIFSISLQLP